MLSRRAFLRFLPAAALVPVLGCAVNPVTGQHQLMLLGEGDEIALDRRQAPIQFSADFGPVQDPRLNTYLTEVGMAVARMSHRPDMPYSFRVVNAPYANAYAFPGGSIAVTRGILARLESEDELAALLGHEIGHVSARHTAARLSSGVVAQIVAGGAAAALGAAVPSLQNVAGDLAGLGAGLVLAKYSRDDERQADALGMEYAVRAGYSPTGMVELMEMLQGLSRKDPSLVEILFSSHPMNAERLADAQALVQGRFASAVRPRARERYLEATARLRALRPALERLEAGQRALAQGHIPQAQGMLEQALSFAPDDYAGLVLLSRAQLAADRPDLALGTARRAQDVYPNEAQGVLAHGMAALKLRRPDQAAADFTRCLQILPGLPAPVFLRGLAWERMGRRPQAAGDYQRYLGQVRSGSWAQYASMRLREWGYVR